MYENPLNTDLKKIGIPRMVGSTGEHKILTYIKEEIEKLKWIAFGDKVSVNNGYFQLKNKVYRSLSFFCLFNPVVLGISLIFSLLQIYFGFALFLLSIFISVIFIIHIINQILKISNLNFSGSASEFRESMNIFCDKKTDRLQPFVLIIVMAHYDSIGNSKAFFQTKRNVIHILIFGFLSLLCHIISFLAFLTNLNIYFHVVMGFGIAFYGFTLYYLIELQKIKIVNNSPGVSDNASGVAVCLNLMRYFEKINLSWCDLRFLFPAAEEYGLFGSKYHLELHKTEFDKYLKTYIINIDTITDSICYQTYNTKKENRTPNLGDIIQNTAISSKINIKKRKEIIGGSDHIPFCKAGFESAFIFSEKHDYIHSEADTIDKINFNMLSNSLELLYRIVLEIDRRASFIIESGSKKF